MFKVTILDYKTLPDREWILCKGNLAEYLTSLKPNFYNFSIQRKIVKNQYLDTLITTIKEGDPIPLITLTYNQEHLIPMIGREIQIDMNEVEILDGLQRTFRLWAHNILVKEFEKNQTNDAATFAKNIKKNYPEFFDSGVVSLTKIRTFFQNKEFEKIKHAYADFEIYFAVWVNLTPKRVIHKMLVLNAGQRSVSTTHQFELLFLYLWEDLQKEQIGITLYREKDADATRVKNGIRKAGEYMFSSVIVGLRSFVENKPLRVSIEDLDISDIGQDDIYSGINEEIFTIEYIKSFLSYLKKLDAIFIDIEGDEGQKWFVKDTSLSGILAGIGSYTGVNVSMNLEELNELTKKGFAELINKVERHGFDLDGFTDQYNILSSRSVNIGTFIRRVIMDYTVELLRGSSPSWEVIFNSKSKIEKL